VPLLYRLLCLGCLAAAAVPFGRAQTRAASGTSTSNSSPGGWLGREEPRAVAWQAYDAMVTHDGISIPKLLSLASQWQPLSPQTFLDDSRWPRLSAGQEEERDAMAEVLDTLIQLNASVPADTLRNLAPDFENAVAVLLARMPIEESGSLSLDFFRSPPKPDHSLQYVSAALLALHPSPDFAGKLLADIKVRATIFVILPGERFGFGSSGSCGDSSEPARDDWPLIGQYKLSLEASEGASVVVAGIDPIYVTRVESSRYLGDCGMGVGLGPEQRRRLIAEMLGVSPEGIPWETSPQIDIEFYSPGQFSAALLAFVEEQQEMYRETAEALVDRDLLTPAELLRSLPELKLTLIDMRREGDAPISNLPDLPTRVEWEP
jgi:hypothetical protein